MKQQFRTIKFHKKNLYLLEKIKEILEEYDEKGIRVTLRQLYYQLVARDIIPNKISEYQKLSTILTNARYNGNIDWYSIEDRVRVPKIPNIFLNVNELIEVACKSYQLDRWEEQKFYIELWTEKDAISSVIYPITQKYQIPVIVNRGYSSASAMFESAQRFLEQEEKTKIILYLGDHDPSGLDMDRDIKKRLNEFEVEVEVIRIGLTKKQTEEYNLPTNPAKMKDPRSKWYVENFGYNSWEVDALRPEVLQQLIENSILIFLDLEKYEQVKKQEQKEIRQLELNLNEEFEK